MEHINYMVESYSPEAYHGHPDELVVSGWFCADEPAQTMVLEIDGDPPLSLPIEHLGLPSPDVERLLGAKGARSRFHSLFRLPHQPITLDRATLRVDFGKGRLSIEVGSIYRKLFFDDQKAAEIVSRCESLGDNCEFGFLQRRLGVNQLGLFRFSGSFSADDIIRAIRARFEGFAEDEDLEAGADAGEWMIRSRRYGFTLHTGRFPHMIDEDVIKKKEGTKLRYLVGKFFEDMADGEKLFVRRVREGDRTAGMIDLHRTMREHGPTRMLWVNEADAEHPHGTILEIEDGLFHGFIGQLAPRHDAFSLRGDLWTDLLRRVPGMVDQTGTDQTGTDQMGTDQMAAGETRAD